MGQVSWVKVYRFALPPRKTRQNGARREADTRHYWRSVPRLSAFELRARDELLDQLQAGHFDRVALNLAGDLHFQIVFLL